jgi:crossover junction endodeoxyribonuclease RuvC
VRIFGIDPGSERTGYGCVETDARVARLVLCGVISAAPADSFPERLAHIHRELLSLLAGCAPDCVAIESLFHAANVRSALKLGHARGVAVLAAVEAGCPVVEYSPAEVKRAIVGYGRAEKHQVQQMIKLLLGLATPPSPHDAADALAVALCHLHSMPPAGLKARLYENRGDVKRSDSDVKRPGTVEADLKVRLPRSWRQYRPPTAG